MVLTFYATAQDAVKGGRTRQTAAQPARKAAPGKHMQEEPPLLRRSTKPMSAPAVSPPCAAHPCRRPRGGGRAGGAYRRGVFVIAVARTRDREAARDLTQEILIAVLKALREGRLRDSEKLSAFIQGTARNLINNYLRTKVRHAEVELPLS